MPKNEASEKVKQQARAIVSKLSDSEKLRQAAVGRILRMAENGPSGDEAIVQLLTTARNDIDQAIQQVKDARK